MSNEHEKAKRISRIFVFVCLLPAVLLPAGSVAQQPAKIPRIGFLSAVGSANAPGAHLEAFR